MKENNEIRARIQVDKEYGSVLLAYAIACCTNRLVAR